MEKKIYKLTLTFIFALNVSYGQISSLIYQSYISGDMGSWKNVLESFHADSNRDNLDLINYQYGYVAFCISQGNEKEAELFLKKSEDLLTRLEKDNYQLSMIYAYKSAFIGFRIGLSPYKAPFIGQKSLTFANKSVEMDENNYFGYIQKGNIAFYTPAMFGGSKTEAMNYYLKALRLIEKNKHALSNNWNYLNLIVTIIQAYVELDQFELAKKYCLKTLALEPDFDWVKNTLYPKIQKHLTNE